MKKILFLFLLTGCNNTPDVKTSDKTPKVPVTVSDTKKAISNSQKNKTASKADTTTYTNLQNALLNPDRVIYLLLTPNSLDDFEMTKHLPADIGKLTNLKVLEIHCLENLEDLPEEIGNLKLLEALNIDEGNGCTMNVLLPASIGQLKNLKILNLNGALDYSSMKLDSEYHYHSPVQYKMKGLPQTITNLQNLEELDLARNGLKVIPAQVYLLKGLKILNLDYNDVSKISDSISNLTNLEELSIISSDTSAVKLPESMKTFKTLKVNFGENPFNSPNQQELERRKQLQKEFPNIVFSYSGLD